MPKLKVLIAGAGLGGLCLAQSLRRLDIEVEIFERDKSPWDRPQGYRLHLDSDGINAIHQSLPPDLYDLFDATSMKPLSFTTIVDTALAVKKRVPDNEHGSTQAHSFQGAPAHMNVNRATLRQVLLAGMDDILRFGKKLTHYESDESGVTALFEDGTNAQGDLLVGADGIRSSVRRQRVPHAASQDSGIRAVYGRVPFSEAAKLVTDQVRGDTFTIALDAQRLFLGLGPVVFPTRPDLAASQRMPKADLRPQDDYLVCIIGGRKELFGLEDSRLSALSSEGLQKVSLQLMKEWPEATRAIPAHGDPNSFFFVEMYTSVPCEVPKSANVTLLGDAIHAMTPTLGRGANIAMRDGALLGRHLGDVLRGRQQLAQALSEYETEMTTYGFDVVKKAAAMGVRMVGQDPLPSES
jgi:2-polyprenyl-6-methoxyphenol hydroxylase-like FAD-dependent oxidoreductase